MEIRITGHEYLRGLGHRINNAPDEFPRTIAMLGQWRIAARDQWIKLVRDRGKGAGQPGWWLTNYLGPGGQHIKTEPGNQPLEFRVFHDDTGAKYRFGRVIEEGRAAYDMKRALATSPKVRRFKTGPLAGVRYLVIPFQAKASAIHNSQVDVELTKIGERRDLSGVLRNIYLKSEQKPKATEQFFDQTQKTSLAVTTQRQSGGTIHRSYTVFAIMHERSPGWIQRPIPGIAYSKLVHQAIVSGRATIPVVGEEMNFQRSMATAAYMDILAGAGKVRGGS